MSKLPSLDVDLQDGVVPISRAASSLAALIKRVKERQRPIIVTQKGLPWQIADCEMLALPDTLEEGSVRLITKQETAAAHVFGRHRVSRVLSDIRLLQARFRLPGREDLLVEHQSDHRR